LLVGGSADRAAGLAAAWLLQPASTRGGNSLPGTLGPTVPFSQLPETPVESQTWPQPGRWAGGPARGPLPGPPCPPAPFNPWVLPCTHFSLKHCRCACHEVGELRCSAQPPAPSPQPPCPGPDLPPTTAAAGERPSCCNHSAPCTEPDLLSDLLPATAAAGEPPSCCKHCAPCPEPALPPTTAAAGERTCCEGTAPLWTVAPTKSVVVLAFPGAAVASNNIDW
jgi:hypothetical protein